MARILTAALASSIVLLLAGCPPSLNGDDDDAVDDDDTVVGDDDDVADDDDVTDDDDVVDDDDTPVDLCAQVGGGEPGFDAWGASPDGAWIEGDIGWDGTDLSVTPFDGSETLAIRIWYSAALEMDELLAGTEGPGRLFWSRSGSGAWSAYGVLAVLSEETGDLFALGYNAGPPESFSEIGFTLRVEPDLAACPEPTVDMSGCGLGYAVPVTVAWGDGRTEVSMQMWPQDAVELGELRFTHYVGYHVPKTNCDDFETTGWVWTLHRP
jgi:hypothetical protein